jgi:pimeloyl-ACP methyl ester carboxylesterase
MLAFALGVSLSGQRDALLNGATIAEDWIQVPGSQPYQDRYVTINGLRLHYLDWGSSGKQPLLILHECCSGIAHSYDHISPQFAKDYHVIAVDLRGHGDSEWSPKGEYFVDDYVKDLEALVDTLKLDNMVLLGASLGGRVVQQYAGTHPERVARLIVEDVGPERPAEIGPNNVRTVARESKGWASKEELLKDLTSRRSRIAESVWRPLVEHGTRQREDGRVIWKRDPDYVKGLVLGDVWKYVRRVTAPTLYILGGESTIVPRHTQEQLKAVGPHVQIVVMPGVGHWPSKEVPDAYVKLIREFLSQPLRRRPSHEPELQAS